MKRFFQNLAQNMPHNIYYLSKAHEDLERILDFIAQDSMQRAQDYLHFLYVSIAKLADFQKLGISCKHKHVRRDCRILIIEDYLIFYQIDETSQSITIGRVLHQSVNYKTRKIF